MSRMVSLDKYRQTLLILAHFVPLARSASLQRARDVLTVALRLLCRPCLAMLPAPAIFPRSPIAPVPILTAGFNRLK